jgi:acetylglutamate kinase
MINSNMERAQTLVEALPYIQKYNRKVVVIKYGGNAMISAELFDAVMEDIILLHLVGIRVVLVHGGGPEINDMLKKIGKQPKFVNGLRYTDRETMDIVQSVLCGKVNKELVATISRKGGRAVGLCGLDGCLIEAKKMQKGDGEDYGLVGDVVNVNPEILEKALEDNRIPVVATVAFGIDEDTAYNINADTAAASLAVSLQAEKLIILTDTRGVLKDPKDDSTLIKVIHPAELPSLIKNGVISSGMIPKVECCAEAIAKGVKRTHIIDGRIPHSILIEMLTDEGAGTMIC